MIVARFVEGIGKGLTIAIGRATLYKQFDRRLLVAIGFYGVCAYATRPLTPLVTAYINDWLSWRWIYWVNVPRRPGRARGRAAVPPSPTGRRSRCACRSTGSPSRCSSPGSSACCSRSGWYRKWGGWTSDAFAVVAVLCVALPVVLVDLAGLGIQPGRAPEAAAPEPGLRPGR